MLEVVIAGCIFKDKNWLAYCFDQEHADMHKDVAFEMLFLDEDLYQSWMGIVNSSSGNKVAKDVRQGSKNGFVFPEIYGCGLNKAATGVWKQLPDITKKHLSKIRMPRDFGGKQSGSYIRNFESFREWMKIYIDYYWADKYPTYKKNREVMYKKYVKEGYVDMITGFRYWGPMSFNNFCNGPVQGPASHIKLWTMHEVEREMRLNKLKSNLIYEIHDSIAADAIPEERPYIEEIMYKQGVNLVRDFWSWIISPLTLEMEVSGVDGDWNTMKGVEATDWIKEEWKK